MHFFAREYSKALGHTITFQDIPLKPWRDELRKQRWPVHLVNHLATMGDLQRAGPLGAQEFVRKNAAPIYRE
jgi:hypothetical protein